MGGMRPATPVELTAEERRTLETWVRSSTTEQRLVLRAKLILTAAAGGKGVRYPFFYPFFWNRASWARRFASMLPEKGWACGDRVE